MIAVVYGTTGELIKLAPLLRHLTDSGQAWLGLCTGQQVRQLPTFLDDLDLPQPDIWLARGHRGRDLQRTLEIPGWAATVTGNLLRRRGRLARHLRSDGHRPVVIVHGDTMTTVLGAWVGRTLGADVGHVEAGMRSGDWRNPFPEELNRRLAAKLVTWHYAPGARPIGNLRREGYVEGIVDTGSNTVRDAVDLVPDDATAHIDLPDEPFGVVSLHRYELIERPSLLKPILEALRQHAQHTPLLFVDHSTTAAAIDALELGGLFDSDRFRRIPRQQYLPFIALLKRASFLVTDSGGCQEECAFLGIPCLVHRAVSEHDTGLGRAVVLSEMKLDVVRAFLADPGVHRIREAADAARPTQLIVDSLRRAGALAGA